MVAVALLKSSRQTSLYDLNVIQMIPFRIKTALPLIKNQVALSFKKMVTGLAKEATCKIAIAIVCVSWYSLYCFLILEMPYSRLNNVQPISCRSTQILCLFTYAYRYNLIPYTLMFCYCHAFLIQALVYEYSSVLSLVIISLQYVFFLLFVCTSKSSLHETKMTEQQKLFISTIQNQMQFM